VLLIDDVTTTGATLREGAEALLAAGASEVQCLAATAAP
jgi:predicted amidophosphoribosyltransferase